MATAIFDLSLLELEEARTLAAELLAAELRHVVARRIFSALRCQLELDLRDRLVGLHHLQQRVRLDLEHETDEGLVVALRKLALLREVAAQCPRPERHELLDRLVALLAAERDRRGLAHAPARRFVNGARYAAP